MIVGDTRPSSIDVVEKLCGTAFVELVIRDDLMRTSISLECDLCFAQPGEGWPLTQLKRNSSNSMMIRARISLQTCFKRFMDRFANIVCSSSRIFTADGVMFIVTNSLGLGMVDQLQEQGERSYDHSCS